MNDDQLAYEAEGIYNVQQLLDEEPTTPHYAYIGPIAIKPLPNEKIRGVVALQDIQKGELVATCFPTIYVPCTVPIDDKSSGTFSAESHERMVVELLAKAQKSKEVEAQVRAFRLVGHNLDEMSLEEACRAVISTTVWNIEHPIDSVSSQVTTKVRGHAFSLNGFASAFNHSCCNNVIMVSYGAGQFFRANCKILAGSELQVSYGTAPLDTVEMRRAKTLEHDFDCSCGLCEWESSLETDKKTSLDLLLKQSRNAVFLAEANRDSDEPQLLAVYKELINVALRIHCLLGTGQGCTASSFWKPSINDMQVSLQCLSCLVNDDFESPIIETLRNRGENVEMVLIRCGLVLFTLVQHIDDLAFENERSRDVEVYLKSYLASIMILAGVHIDFTKAHGNPLGDQVNTVLNSLADTLADLFHNDDEEISSMTWPKEEDKLIDYQYWQAKAAEYMPAF